MHRSRTSLTIGLWLSSLVGVAGFAWLLVDSSDNDAGTAVVGAGVAFAAMFGALLMSGKEEVDATSDEAGPLAEAVQGQWVHAAMERRLLTSPIPVAWKQTRRAVTGRLAGAPAPARFQPLPDIEATAEQLLRDGGGRDELHALYARLESGRLVIIGQPGSGKTGAAIHLVLDALEHRQSVPAEVRQSVPVPVMFTLQGWDPGRERFEDWLVARLAESYPLLARKSGAARARRLLAAGKLAVILDGLDEIAETLRPAALRALSDQTAFRVVVLTRSEEMVAAAEEEHFVNAAAVELQDVDTGAAADFLASVRVDPAPPGWSDLIESLRAAPDSPIAKALTSPLALTLLRDTYRTVSDVRELIDIAARAPHDDAGREAVEDHLLNRVLVAAYGPRAVRPPGRYDLPTAEAALRYIARRMSEDATTRDLRWWYVAKWAPSAPRLAATFLLAVVVPVLAVGLGSGRGLEQLVITAVVFGIAYTSGIAAPTGGRPPQQIPTLKRILSVQALAGALAIGLVGAFGAGLSGRLIFNADFASGFTVGLVAGFVGGLFVFDVPNSIAEDTSSLTPLGSWRVDRRFGVVVGVVIAVVGGLASALASDLGGGPVADAVFEIVDGTAGEIVLGLVGGFAFGALFALTLPQSWAASLAFAQLSIRHRTPLRLMRFLEDAHERDVLRIVGPVYQFRHARLQDRLGTNSDRVIEPPPEEPD